MDKRTSKVLNQQFGFDELQARVSRSPRTCKVYYLHANPEIYKLPKNIFFRALQRKPCKQALIYIAPPVYTCLQNGLFVYTLEGKSLVPTCCLFEVPPKSVYTSVFWLPPVYTSARLKRPRKVSHPLILFIL
jgi:hypothetical protein